MSEGQLDELFGNSEEGEGGPRGSGEHQAGDDDFAIFEQGDMSGTTSDHGASSPRSRSVSPRPGSRTQRKRTLSDVRSHHMELRRLEAPAKPLLLKLPGFMGIQAEEYRPSAVLERELGVIIGDAATPIKDDPAESSLLLRVATTMRWRCNAETNERESNAHLVKWSDGSYSLLVGEEHFEVSLASMAAEHNYIYGRHAEVGCMESLGKLSERLMVRPFIIAGDDQGHRKYLAAAAAASAKASADVRVKMAVTIADPEQEKQRMIKLEQEKIKARRKIEAKRRNLKQRSFERVSRTGLTAKFLEEDDLEELGEVERGGAYENEDEYEEDFIDDTNIEEDGADEEEEEESEESDAEESESVPESESESEAQSTEDERGEENEEDQKTGKRLAPAEGEIPRKRGRKALILEEDEDE